jgi:hypothetical protein
MLPWAQLALAPPLLSRLPARDLDTAQLPLDASGLPRSKRPVHGSALERGESPAFLLLCFEGVALVRHNNADHLTLPGAVAAAGGRR